MGLRYYLISYACGTSLSKNKKEDSLDEKRMSQGVAELLVAVSILVCLLPLVDTAAGNDARAHGVRR